MVDFFDNVQSFYEAPTLELLSDPSASDFFGDEFDTQIFPDPQGSSFMDFNYDSGGVDNTYLRSSLTLPSQDQTSTDYFDQQPDNRSYFKMLQERLGLDNLLDEKSKRFFNAAARAAGLLDKNNKPTEVGLGRTPYKPKTKTPTMKQAAAISGAKRTANNMASLSRTAPNGNQYLQRQNFNDFVNRVSTGDFGTTGSGPRGTNIKEASLKAIAARKYVPKA